MASAKMTETIWTLKDRALRVAMHAKDAKTRLKADAEYTAYDEAGRMAARGETDRAICRAMGDRRLSLPCHAFERKGRP